MKEVRFAEYRRYEARRVEVRNAMMALLAGAGMASHLLQLTRGSRHLLPEGFPRVPHIGRFNLRTEVARQILDAADTHLGAMSVPYGLAGREAPAGRALHRRGVQSHQSRPVDRNPADAQLHGPCRRPLRPDANQGLDWLDTQHRGGLGQAHWE